MNEEDIVIYWEQPPLVKPEFRLYYDDKGKVICYTCDKLEGNYIVIDASTFAEGRPDIRVVDGRIVRVSTSTVIAKLAPSDEGISCAFEDMSIVVNDKYDGKIQKWNLELYEL